MIFLVVRIYEIFLGGHNFSMPNKSAVYLLGKLYFVKITSTHRQGKFFSILG